MFYTETHLHTAEVSLCAGMPAREGIRCCAEKGYSTVFITDHFKWDFWSQFGDDVTNKEKVERFFEGYRQAKDEGEKLGITVLPAAEISTTFAPNHYLLYGDDIASFLEQHPEIVTFKEPEPFFETVHRAGMFCVQAHPFRRNCIPTHEGPDAYEAYNTAPDEYSPDQTEKALALAAMHAKPITGGSDAHFPNDTGRGGVGTEQKIETPSDYIAAVRSGSVTPLHRF